MTYYLLQPGEGSDRNKLLTAPACGNPCRDVLGDTPPWREGDHADQCVNEQCARNLVLGQFSSVRAGSRMVGNHRGHCSYLDQAKKEACLRAIETLTTAQRESTLLIGPAPGFTLSLR